MKLVRQMPLPPKFKKNRASRVRNLASALNVGDGYDECTPSEKERIYIEIYRSGFNAATMKTNNGYRVWKLDRKL